MARAIGIDLGTYFSEVACLENGKPKVIPNAENQSSTPSVVAFIQGGKVLVGQMAKRQATANPQKTIFSIKRRMGSGETVNIDGREYTPQEISSFILRKLKADAEEYLGEKVDKAVITVPAYFNERQRQATEEAGALADLDVIGLLNEPTATALAYGLQQEEAHTVLIWDLGAGTFDVSILDLGEKIFEVKAISGDAGLGGDDFTRRIVDHLASQFKKYCEVPLPKEPEIWLRLNEEAEKAKIRLCYSPAVRLNLPFLTSNPEGPRLPEMDLSREQFKALNADLVQRLIATTIMELTREQFKEITADLLQRLIAPTIQALKDAGITPEKVDRVILAGGGCLMPTVRELAIQMLKKEPYRYIDPFTVVAQGAAIYAGMLLGEVEKTVLLDVPPLSLGVETQGGLFARIIPRNTPLPALETQVFTTAADNQTSMDINVLQGERELAADNILLGHFQLDGIPPARRGAVKVEVAFEADVDGIVRVSARDLTTGKAVNARLTSTKQLDPEEIEHLKQEAQRNDEQDKDKRARILAGIEADNTIAAAELALEELAGSSSDSNVRAILALVDKVKEALASGVVEEIRLQNGELKHLLTAIHKENPIPSLQGNG